MSTHKPDVRLQETTVARIAAIIANSPLNDFSHTDCIAAVNYVNRCIADLPKTGGEINIRNFGNFTVAFKKCKEHEKHFGKRRAHVHFKMAPGLAKSMKEHVKRLYAETDKKGQTITDIAFAASCVEHMRLWFATHAIHCTKLRDGLHELMLERGKCGKHIKALCTVLVNIIFQAYSKELTRTNGYGSLTFFGIGKFKLEEQHKTGKTFGGEPFVTRFVKIRFSASPKNTVICN